MDTILVFVKNYFIFMIILFLVSYLVPKEDYRKYFQFFIGVLMVVVLMRPVIRLFDDEEEERLRAQLEQMETDIGQMEYYEKGENIFERFFQFSGVDEEASEEPE